VGYRKFKQAPVHHTLIFTPIACIETTDENLDWVEFSNFFELISTNGHIEWHVIQTFLDLSPNSPLVNLWVEFKNHKGIHSR
jgi:hypothetical protein